MLTIGEYVQREKQARGWTLDRLAEMTGIRPSHLSRLIKHSPRTPDVQTVKKFASAFCVEPAAIWREIGGPPSASPSMPSHRLAGQIEQYLNRVPPDKREAAERILISHAQQLSEVLAG